MSIRRWPDSLPLLGSGMEMGFRSAVVRTETEVGARSRRITFSRLASYTINGVTTRQGWGALEAWWRDEPWSLTGASDSLAGWTLTGATRNGGGAIGPDEVACDVLVEDTSTGGHRVQRALSDPGWQAGDRAVIVCSLLPLGRSAARVAVVGRDGTARGARIDLAVPTVAALDAEAEARVVPHMGWVRVTVAAGIGAGTSPVRARIAALDGAAESYTGAGTAALAIGQVNTRRGRVVDGVFVPTAGSGAALGASAGAQVFRARLPVGAELRWIDVLAGAEGLQSRPVEGLNYTYKLQVDIFDA